jgi:hypothetical protein
MLTVSVKVNVGQLCSSVGTDQQLVNKSQYIPPPVTPPSGPLFILNDFGEIHRPIAVTEYWKAM